MGADQHLDLRASIASALEWWSAAGVDCEIDDAPRDWLAHGRAVEAAVAAPSGLPETAAAAPLPSTLAAFVAWRSGPAAPEARWPGQPIGVQGDAASGLMIVADMPDREDDRAGALLSGQVGQLFDRMLAAIGRDRQSVYIAALAAKRPPAGRVTDETADRLAELLRHHIALAAPTRVLALGNAASRALTGLDVAHARNALRPINQQEGKAMVVASYHPRFLLERPAAKADAWRDLQLLTGETE